MTRHYNTEYRDKKGRKSQSAASLIMAEANSPTLAGWHFDRATSRYELTHCGLTAWIRRSTFEDVASLELAGGYVRWLVGLIGNDKPVWMFDGSAAVGIFTVEVKQGLYRLALAAPVEADDYGIEPRMCGNSWGG